ncbi:MAG: ribosomal RNA small subunit methyltransferase A [Candidatus Marinimicrobia bacterium]|nr:ribosomal RNA small subunit methyltransferase A [Candidatus Neomarinimicrobiota bacterium]
MSQYAKKRLGQNFLIDPNILRKIADAINPQKHETILEIGPGRGALTKHLLASGAVVHAIELDSDLLPELKEKFAAYDTFHLHHGDALKFDFTQILTPGKKIKYTGNVPYNITSPLLEIAYQNAQSILGVYFLVQKEFAKRIAAHPGNKDYGILSVLSQYFGEPKIHFDVSPQVFRPVPKVTSSFFSILFNNDKIDYALFESLRQTVRMAFNKRRKTLRNSLRQLLPEKNENCPVELGKRPEELSLEDFLLLVKYLTQKA